MANSVTRQLLLQEAARRGWKTQAIGEGAEILRVESHTGQVEMFHGSRPMKSAANGHYIAVYKNLTLRFVELLGYTVPAYKAAETVDEAAQFLAAHGKIVVKPIDGSQSKGVTVGITTPETLDRAMQEARLHSNKHKVIVQKQIEGKLYRIFVLNGSVPVITERRAAQVVGDGVSTVQELVVQLNADPKRGDGSDTPLKRIKLSTVGAYLGADGLQRVPSEGEVVRVAEIESVSAGGEAVNVTAQAHPSWSVAACAITKEMGLFLSGFDIMCDNIAKPVEENYIPLLEINGYPGLKIHEYPSAGEPVHLAPLIFDSLFA